MSKLDQDNDKQIDGTIRRKKLYLNLAITAFILTATVNISWTIINDWIRYTEGEDVPAARVLRWHRLVDTNGVIYAIIAVALVLVNTALICMLKQHASRGKINILIWWSVTFTLTYGLRAGF
jgi:hypothetical protein